MKIIKKNCLLVGTLLLSFQILFSQNPTAPTKGFQIFSQNNLALKNGKVTGTLATGNDFTIIGNQEIATDNTATFSEQGLKIGLLVGKYIRYKKQLSEPICDCTDETTVINSSFEENASHIEQFEFRYQDQIPGWKTTSNSDRIDIIKDGLWGYNSNSGNYFGEINGASFATLYQVICTEPGSTIEWSIYHKGRDGTDVANVLIGDDVETATVVKIMETSNSAWVKYSGTYKVPENQHKTYIMFKAISSIVNKNRGNFIDDFSVKKIEDGTCPVDLSKELTCDCGEETVLMNQSFEDNVSNITTFDFIDQEEIPGWKTTASDGKIEIVKTNSVDNIPSQNRNYHVEINGNLESELYQEVCAEPGAILEWSFYHRGKKGVDVAELKIGKDVTSAITAKSMSTDNLGWKKYTGSYTVPENQSKTYFVFKGISTSENDITKGNLLDNLIILKTQDGYCTPNENTNIVTIKNPAYYVKMGSGNGTSIWYRDQKNNPANIRVVSSRAQYDSNTRIELNANATTLDVSHAKNHMVQPNLIDFTDAFQKMNTYSANMSNCNNSVQLTDENDMNIPVTNLPKNIKIKLENGINILNISGADLTNLENITFTEKPSAAKHIIINVNTSESFNWNVTTQNNAGLIESQFILYNFYNTKQLNITGTASIYGTLYAPKTNITKTDSGDIYGQIVANDFTANDGDFYYAKFTPTITSCDTSTSTIPIADFSTNNSTQCYDKNEFSFTNSSNTGNDAQPENPITYLWNFGDGTSSTETNPTKTFATASTFDVKLTATNSFGSDTKTIQLEVLNTIDAQLSITTTKDESDGTVSKEITLNNDDNFTTFSWSSAFEGENLYPNQKTVSFVFSEEGEYEIKLHTTTNGCFDVTIIPITITSEEVSTGNDGGLESESLGDAISKRYLQRKMKSVPTVFEKSVKNSYNKRKMLKSIAKKTTEQTLLEMFPSELVTGNVANITSPTDILDYTIADEVLSVDFSVDDKTIGVVLGVKTLNQIYNHTKATCDRLRGAEILNVKAVEVNGYKFLQQAIKQRNGNIEHAISFAIGKNGIDSFYSLQTNWYVFDYTEANSVFNFQIWAAEPANTLKMLNDILTNLNAFAPVKQTEEQKIPKSFSSKIYRKGKNMFVNLKNIEENKDVEITMEELYNETSSNYVGRYTPLKSEITQTFESVINDGYEYNGLIKVDGETQDAFYHADGNWGLEYDKRFTTVNDYKVTNNFDREYTNDELPINRNIHVKAYSEFDYLAVYKSLLPGTISADYSQYKYLSFTASGQGPTQLVLVKSSVENWSDQYRTIVNLTAEEQTFFIPFNSFSSIATSAKMEVDDLTTVSFTYTASASGTNDVDLKIGDVKFTETQKALNIDAIFIDAKKNEFTLYPNPSKGNINCTLFSDLATEANVTLYDITGKTVYKGNLNLSEGKNELNFNFKTKAGIMFLKINSPEINYGTSKIIFK